MREGGALEFNVYSQPLVMVSSFFYLGWTLAVTDDDCRVVVINLQRSRRTWAGLYWILGREGADAWTLGQL